VEELPTEKINLIHKYLGPGLSDHEDIHFKSYLTESSFREELLFRTEVLEAVSENRLDDASQVIKEARLEYKDNLNDKAPNKSAVKFLVGGIVVFFILAAGIHFLMNRNTKLRSSQIFAENYQPYPPQQSTRGASLDTNADFDEAMRYYVAEDYEKASESLKNISINSDNIKLYQGISYLEQDNFEAAEIGFKSLMYSESKSLAEQGEWYLSLLYYKHKMPLKGDSVITKIAKDPTHIFYNRAQKILSDN